MTLTQRLGGLIDPFRRAEGPPPKTLFAFFSWGVQGAWPMLVFAALISASAGTLEVVTAFLLGRVIDSAAGDPIGYFAQNWLLLLGFAVFFLGLRPLAFGISATLQGLIVSPQIATKITARLHRWTLNQPVEFFDNDFAGRIASKQSQTTNAMTNVIVEVINVVFFAIASVIGSLLLVLTLDWRLGLAMLVWVAAYLWMISWFMPRLRAKSKTRAAARAAVGGQIVDTITNIKTVKLFANSQHEDSVALDAMETLRQRMLEYGAISSIFRFALMGIAGVLPVMLIGGAVLLWQAGTATAGDIAAAGAVSIRLAQMTGWVSFTLMAIYSNIGEVEDGMRTLTPRPTVTDRADAVDFVLGDGEVRFDDLTYTYGSDRNGVHGISLTLQPGEKVGLVGASGAGKSTLVALMLRLYDPERGRVLMDGQDLQDVKQESARQHIGMVTQETAMFNRSAWDNIRYGRPDATQEQVIAAARAAEAHEFIKDLRDHMGREGYDAFLGERGVKLSGGQRQRIALARAILKDAPILVLDEATSALDSEVEAQIQAALETVMDGKTVLAIAHRLSTLSQMDRILVMDAGRIVEEGSHADLLARGGLYARYWHRQSGGYLTLQDAAE
ncbi:MAG: ABC transporter ATP-binding protein [Pseudomonadota bacterium]